MYKELDAIEEELKQVSEQVQLQIEEFNAEVEEARTQVKLAEKKLESAKNGTDVQVYQEALTEKEKADDTLAFFENKGEFVPNGITISKSKEIRKAIEKSLRKESNDVLSVLLEIEKKLEPNKETLSNYEKKSEQLLKVTSRLLYGEDYRERQIEHIAGQAISDYLKSEEYALNIVTEIISHIRKLHESNNYR